MFKVNNKDTEQVNAGWIYYMHRVISVICSKEKNYDSNNNSFEF